MTLPNIGDMPDAPQISDRELLIHLVSRMEQLWEEIERLRPLLNLITASNGKPDMIALMQARREVKKAGRHGP